MIFLAAIVLIGFKSLAVTSIPVPPKNYQVSGNNHGPGPKVTFSRPVVFPDDPTTEVTISNSADTMASLPSVIDEKTGRGWIQNVAGPPLYSTQGTVQPQFYNSNSKQAGSQYKASGMGQRLNTAHEYPSDYEESRSQDNGSEGDPDGFPWQEAEGGQLTARLHATHADKEKTPFVEPSFREDDDVEYGDWSNRHRYIRQNAQMIHGNDPNRDSNFADYPPESPFRNSLRHLLRKPLYAPLEDFRPGARIKDTDSYTEAVGKMWDNVQGIPERSSVMEQTTFVQSTVRLGEGPSMTPISRANNLRQISEFAGQSPPPSASLRFDQGRSDRDPFFSISNVPSTLRTGLQYDASNINQMEPGTLTNQNSNTLGLLPVESPYTHTKQKFTKVPQLW
ncbi:hypothetical protein AA313_de0208036 [Arthrobotrys entomopaga]|nr:hypothetical protein AA313_de0208036 [Arthrobotrys entomopaga]